MWRKPNFVDVRQHIDIPSVQHKQVMGMDIAYRVWGHGYPVFCAPPWPSSSAVFAPFANAVGNSCQIIALDLPGWGGHSDKMKLKPTMEHFAEVYAEFVNSFAKDKFALLGYSMGGATIMSALGRNKLTPEKIVYVSTLHSGDDLFRERQSIISLTRRLRIDKMPERVIKPIIAKYMTNFRQDKDRIYSAFQECEIFRYIFADDLRSTVRDILGLLFSIENLELLDGELLKYPSMVVYADTDPAFIKKGSRELAGFLKTESVYLENVDHDHFVFDVNKSTEVILNFLMA